MAWHVGRARDGTWQGGCRRMGLLAQPKCPGGSLRCTRIGCAASLAHCVGTGEGSRCCKPFHRAGRGYYAAWQPHPLAAGLQRVGMQGTRILTGCVVCVKPRGPPSPWARLCEGRYCIYPGRRAHAAAGADREAHQRGHAHRRQRLVRPPAGHRAGSAPLGGPPRRACAARSPRNILSYASRAAHAVAPAVRGAGRQRLLHGLRQLRPGARGRARAARQRRAGQRTRQQEPRLAQQRPPPGPAAGGRARGVRAYAAPLCMMCAYLVGNRPGWPD